jgi:hypothetical protein
MSSVGDYGFYHATGWCPGCGRKRAADGRCVNCDAWWASPLIRFGGPLVLATTLLVAGAVRFLGTPAPPPRVAAAALRSRPAAAAAPPVWGLAFNGPSPARPAAFPHAGYAAAAATAPPPVIWTSLWGRGTAAAPSPAAESDARYAEQVRLRTLTAYVDAAIAADDLARRAAGAEAALTAAAAAPVGPNGPAAGPLGRKMPVLLFDEAPAAAAAAADPAESTL